MIEVDVGGKKAKVVMAVDDEMKSDHDAVTYRSGYSTGPANPLPQNEAEAEIFAKQKVVNDANEYFEEIKKDTEEKREEREAAWAEQELSVKEKFAKLEERKAKREAKKVKEAKEKDLAEGVPVVDASYGYAADDDPDNLENYHGPGSDTGNVFGNLASSLETSVAAAKNSSRPTPSAAAGAPPKTVPDTSKASTDTSELVAGELRPPGEEDTVEEGVQVAHTSGNTRIVVLNQGEEEGGEQGPELKKAEGIVPEEGEEQCDEQEDTADMVDQNVVDMAMAVALEMEEKRRRKEWAEIKEGQKKKEAEKLQKEADELAKEAERSDLSLDELTTLRQLEAKLGVGFGQSRGPVLPGVNPRHGQQQHRAALDAYWEFVRENPQDFNGWAYLIQACETVDIMDEIRTVYNAFLPLFPYCYAYWKRYSDIERKAEHWQRALAILHRGLGAIPLSVDLWVAYLELYHKMYTNHDNFGKLFRFWNNCTF